MQRVKVALFGVGTVGLSALRSAAQWPGIEVVGAVDHAPDKTSRALTELTGMGVFDGLRVSRDLEELFREAPPELIIHTASSRVAEIFAQIRPALELGVSVVSSGEELVFPALKEPQLSREIDGLCRHTGARVVAVGLGAGFALDLLPVFLTGACRQVERIEVIRVAEAAVDRPAALRLIGCGENYDEFAERLRLGAAGQPGLPESAALVARALGWKLDEIVQEGEPVVAAHELRAGSQVVPPGQVCGVRQRVTAWAAGVPRISLEQQLSLAATNPRISVVVHGQPSVNLRLEVGDAGGTAAAGALLNAVPRLLATAPGLHLLTDLAPLHWSGGPDGAPQVFRI